MLTIVLDPEEKGLRISRKQCQKNSDAMGKAFDEVERTTTRSICRRGRKTSRSRIQRG